MKSPKVNRLTPARKIALREAASRYRDKWKTIRDVPILELENLKIILLDPWNIALVDVKAKTDEVVGDVKPEEGKVVGYFGGDLVGALTEMFRKLNKSANAKSVKERSDHIKETEKQLTKLVNENLSENVNKLLEVAKSA